MKTPTHKRAAAALVLDAIDQLRCGQGFDDMGNENDVQAIIEQLEKIVAPIEDRMLTITGGLENAIDIRRHYNSSTYTPSDLSCSITTD